MTALIAGEIPLAFETVLALQPHVRAGTLRALATTSPRRSAAMPEILTTAEAGFPQMVADNSYALFAPAGTPAPILARLHEATVAALRYRTSATGCASKAPRWSATAQPSWPPMLQPKFRNGPRWRARPA